MLKRVLVLTFEFPPQPGGIGTYAHQVAKGISDRGVEVSLVAACGKVSMESIREHDANLPYRVRRFPRRYLRSVSLLNRFLVAIDECRRFSPDLVLVCNYGATYLAGLLSVLFGVEYVVMGHGTEFLAHQKGVEGKVYTRLLKRARSCLANSRYTRDLMCDAMGVEEQKVEVIPLGADSDLFIPGKGSDVEALRQQVGGPDRFVMLTVGRLSERKGQEVAIRSLAELADEHPSLSYVIVGRGPSLDKLKALAAELGVADRVHFAGMVEDEELPAYYEMADLFVLPSRQTQSGEVEGFGIVVCEAGLMQVPAVGTRGSGIEDAIIDGVTGVLVQPDSHMGLAAAIEEMIVNADRRQELGIAARANAMENHTWDKVGARTVKHLRSVA